MTAFRSGVIALSFLAVALSGAGLFRTPHNTATPSALHPALIQPDLTLADLSDLDGDGMPDALHLDTDADQQAFRKWFTFLAEAQFANQQLGHEAEIPTEINDCAALIRYAYREALKSHEGGWSADVQLPMMVALPSIGKYQYPRTLLGSSLFRVKSGRFVAADLKGDSGAFAQFADASTLQRLNTHFITREVRKALPGDLLFFRHEASDSGGVAMPFHTMMYLGNSQLQDGGQTYLLYHTGPSGSGSSKDPGELRRPTVAELMQHPDPRWRPMAGNPTFLGVYRWNILR